MAHGSASGKPPNIVTILVDQLRYDALSCMGNKVVRTPNLDRLAGQGMLFRQATCAYPLCGPSRASLLTGMYAHRHGFIQNAEIKDGGGIGEAIPTVDELLKENGYHTVYFGKWHTGAAHRECYAGGLDYYLKEYKAEMDRKYPPPHRLPAGWKIDRYTKREYEPVPLDDMMERAPGNGYSMPHHNEAGRCGFAPEDSLTAWTVRKAMRFLESAPPEPFAMTCSILHPHAPLIAVEPYFSMFDPAQMPMPDNVEDNIRVKRTKPVPGALPLSPEGLGTYMALYYGLVKELDDWVGRLLQTLDDCDLADRTFVLFTADHGELMGSHGTLSKMEMFEESIRVPLIVRGPGAAAGGAVSEAAVSGVDLAPTILDVAGVPIPERMQGRSLKPLLAGKEADGDAEYAYCEMKDQVCIRSRDWKLVLNPSLNSNLAEPALLFHLQEDPGEQTNLLADGYRTAEAVANARRLRDELVAMLERWACPAEKIAVYAAVDWASEGG